MPDTTLADDGLGLGYYLPADGSPLWSPVGTGGSLLFDPLLRYVTDIAFALVELIATKDKQNPPNVYRKVGSEPLTIGGSAVKTRAVSDRDRGKIVNKAVQRSTWDLEEVVSGPLAGIRNRPNDRETFGRILYANRQKQEIWGRSFLLFEKDFNRVWSLPYTHNQRATYAANLMDITKYHLNGKDYDPDSIIPFVYANQANSYAIECPVSPLKAALKSLFLNDRYFHFIARCFENGTNPPFALVETVDQTGHAEKRETLATDIKTQITDNNDGTPPVIPYGYELKQFTAQYKDLIGNVEQQKLIRLIVCNCFGMPNAIFDSTATARNVLDATLLQMYDLGITPRIEERDEILTHFFRRVLKDDSIIFATPDPRPADDDKIRADMQMLLQFGAIKKNEARSVYKAYGLEPDPAFDETATKPAPQTPSIFDDALPEDLGEQPVNLLDQSDKLLGIQNAYYTGTLPREAALGQLQLVFGMSPENAEKLLPPKEAGPAPAPTLEPTPAPVKAKAKKTASRDDLESILIRFFRRQRAAVLAKLSGNEKAVKGKAFTPGVECYWWNAKADVSDVEPFFSIQEANKELFDDVYPVLSIMYERAAEAHLIKLGIDEDLFGVYSHKLKPVIRQRVLRFADSTNRTSLLALNDAYSRTKEALQEGLTEGQNLEQLRKAVAEVYEQAEDYRTFRIAKTESDIARTQSEHWAAKEAGVTGMKNLPSPDACPECQAIAEKAGDEFYPMDHRFGGTDYSGYLPPYHPQCRCTLLFQTGGE